jgi:hypothetical protein
MSNFSEAAIGLGIGVWKGWRGSWVGKSAPVLGLADEAEEGFPAAGDDEAEEFGVGGGYLVGVDGGLWGWG